MTICLNTFSQTTEFPATETPHWAPKVDRWYQLDQPAYSITQAYDLLREHLGPRPDLIILASPRASNDTDHAFTKTMSPSKFVHTLPNIRAVPLLQVMEWAGPLICIQNDPQTPKSGVEQALLYLETLNTVWVIGFNAAETTFQVLTRQTWGKNPRVFENRQAALEQL